jgi:hypothetical protein
MYEIFYSEILKSLQLEKTAVDLRKVQNLSRAQSPGIKLLSSSNVGKPIKPVFNNSTNPNFPYQKPQYKGGLRNMGVNTPSATPNMQV